MAVTLEEAWEKLRWARHHYEPLRKQIESFQKRSTHRLSVDIDADAGKYTFHVHSLEMVDPDWGLQVGDCLHNARTALDYLVVQLVALASGDDPKTISGVGFPIFDSPADFESRTRRLAKEPPLSGYLARLQELQPFDNGNPSIWGYDRLGAFRPPRYSHVPIALSRLREYDDVAKHRVIHPCWLSHASFAPRPWPEPPGIPTNFKLVSESFSAEPLVDGAEIGSLTFETPLAGEWEPEEMEMKRYFPIEVAFAEGTAEVNAVLEVVPYCFWAVESVLNLFEPVFRHGDQPLPVRSLPDARLGHPVRPLPPAR